VPRSYCAAFKASSYRIRDESATGKRYEATSIIDMAEWKGAQQLGSPRLYRIANSIVRIHRDIGHFASGFRRLGIGACNQDDRNRESNELCKLYEDELRESDRARATS
jgi:hypothetical protein